MPPPMLETVFNHLTLPPRLPGTQDLPEKIGAALIDRLLDASRSIRDCLGNRGNEWERVCFGRPPRYLNPHCCTRYAGFYKSARLSMLEEDLIKPRF